MAVPTEAQAKQQIQDTVKIWDEHRKYVGTTGAGATGIPYVTREQTVTQELKSAYANIFTPALQAARGDLNSFILRLPSVLAPLILDYGQVINVPETNPTLVFGRLYQYYIDNSFAVQSRLINYGTVTAVGSPNGSGVFYRCTVDENGYPLEATTPDIKTLRCLADAQSGVAIGEEQFEVRGQSPNKDFLVIQGSGVFTGVRGVSGRDSQNIISNPSFDSFGGTAASPNPITNWTPNVSLSNFAIDQVNYYRSYQGVATPGALKILASDGVSQNINVSGNTFISTAPYFFAVAWNRQVYNCTGGTLTLTVGGISVSVVISAQTGWQILVIPIGKKSWFKNFNANTLAIQVAVSGLTGGALLVDDVIICPFQFIDGTWITPLGGSTLWLRYDKYQYQDQLFGNDSILQQWIGWRTYGSSFPSAISTPPASPAITATAASGGAITTGLHSWYCTFVGSTGVGESAAGAHSNQLNIGSGNQTVNLTTIPLGPAGTTARNIYRTVAGDTGSPKLVGTISDNVTTIFTDNIADGSLGVNAPNGVTWPDP